MSRLYLNQVASGGYAFMNSENAISYIIAANYTNQFREERISLSYQLLQIELINTPDKYSICTVWKLSSIFERFTKMYARQRVFVLKQ